MTIESRDLFELCKEVYERFPEWETSDWYDLDPDGIPEEYLCTTEDKIDENDYIPNYTSDYLLKKLPSVVQDPYDKIFRHIQMWINGDRSANAGYVEPYAHDDRVAYAQKSDEMRITLLKLTLKLHEEGLL